MLADPNEPKLEQIRAYLSVESTEKELPGWRRERAAVLAKYVEELMATLRRFAGE